LPLRERLLGNQLFWQHVVEFRHKHSFDYRNPPCRLHIYTEKLIVSATAVG
jgi:hypothetical protein